ncbi:MAG: ATP-dependent Clp protease adaptor ClpS [Flavobacteriales bacterium]|jgi:ATP-dependent Clp protease adaptor protein ClpS|nr:ATP-dependent Clp protease adaptor ClpS [Flavobacteriales bacterium]MBT5090234.1 ATP-dependent Clp protease adaptor ClpS [Flavobacteriales bacterium]MBT5750054.1 ATP-dependent Clp protease adaptor ClpS [Flavobacteriales bacterium]
MKKSEDSISKATSGKTKIKSLFLVNDDFNSFDYVVDCLTAICDHETIQAEQCALLTHYKGSCEIAMGENADLELLREDLALYGLNVEIL